MFCRWLQPSTGRWQVEKRALGLCNKCPLSNKCSIQEFPEEIQPRRLDLDPLLDRDLDSNKTAGPNLAVMNRAPKYVLLTSDSIGDNDAPLIANPDLHAVFLFNEEALRKLQLSAGQIDF